MLHKIVVDRSGIEAAMAIVTTWIALMMALPVFDPDVASPLNMLVWAPAALLLVIVGFAAASRVRPMSIRKTGERARLLMWSLSLGALMGVINLSVNLGMAALDPALHRLLVERFARVSAQVSVLAAPVVEEVAFRLIVLSLMAVVVARFVGDRRRVFWTALAVSALVFGVLHVMRPEPASIDLVWAYRTGVTLKSTLGGVLLGWVFWRWGLAYAVASHFAINGTHVLLEPLAFGP